jgi:hypothetical protein
MDINAMALSDTLALDRNQKGRLFTMVSWMFEEF